MRRDAAAHIEDMPGLRPQTLSPLPPRISARFSPGKAIGGLGLAGDRTRGSVETRSAHRAPARARAGARDTRGCDHGGRRRDGGSRARRGAGGHRQVPTARRGAGARRGARAERVLGARGRAGARLPVRGRAAAVRVAARRRQRALTRCSRARRRRRRRCSEIDGAVEEGEPVGEGTFAVLHGLYWLTINLCSERALLLAVDDLHWCDRASLRFLAYLARRLEDLPIVLVASLRSSEPEADPAILQELTSEPHAQVLVPGPLYGGGGGRGRARPLGRARRASLRRSLLLVDRRQSAAAQRASQGPRRRSSAARRCPRRRRRRARAAGRVASGGAPASTAVSATRCRSRVRSPPSATARSCRVVAELAELEAPALAAATRELVRAEILRPEPPLGFVHPLVQAAVYHDLAPGERELYHERAASAPHRAAAPRRSRSPHTCSSCPRAARSGWSTCCAPPLMRQSPRAIPTRRSRCYDGRWTSRRRPTCAWSYCSSLGRLRQ